MINLLNQHNIDYIINNNLASLKHLNMFLHKQLNEMLKNKEYIYISEFNAKVKNVKCNSDFNTLRISVSLGGSFMEHNFHNFTPKFQRCLIDAIKNHLINEIAWDD